MRRRFGSRQVDRKSRSEALVGCGAKAQSPVRFAVTLQKTHASLQRTAKLFASERHRGIDSAGLSSR
jgi:hypothetical protein